MMKLQLKFYRPEELTKNVGEAVDYLYINEMDVSLEEIVQNVKTTPNPLRGLEQRAEIHTEK